MLEADLNRLAKNQAGLHLRRSITSGSGAGIAPVIDFSQTLGTSLLEQANPVPSVLKFVDVGPNFRLPGLKMNRRFATGGASGMQSSNHPYGCGARR